MGDSTTTRDEVVLRFDDPRSSRAVVLEDDGRVAYAYLLEDQRIVSDVWLYNVANAPISVDWTDRSAMPFLNPRDLCRAESFERLTPHAAVECRWSADAVEVLIKGVLMARLERGAKPGWSRLASKRGPLAIPLES